MTDKTTTTTGRLVADEAPDTLPEYAEISATRVRKMGTDPRDPGQPGAGPRIAQTDLLVERTDLGTDSHVFVAEGDRVPTELVGPPADAVLPAPSANAKKISADKVA